MSKKMIDMNYYDSFIKNIIINEKVYFAEYNNKIISLENCYKYEGYSILMFYSNIDTAKKMSKILEANYAEETKDISFKEIVIRKVSLFDFLFVVLVRMPKNHCFLTADTASECISEASKHAEKVRKDILENMSKELLRGYYKKWRSISNEYDPYYIKSRPGVGAVRKFF